MPINDTLDKIWHIHAIGDYFKSTCNNMTPPTHSDKSQTQQAKAYSTRSHLHCIKKLPNGSLGKHSGEKGTATGRKSKGCLGTVGLQVLFQTDFQESSLFPTQLTWQLSHRWHPATIGEEWHLSSQVLQATNLGLRWQPGPWHITSGPPSSIAWELNFFLT